MLLLLLSAGRPADDDDDLASKLRYQNARATQRTSLCLLRERYLSSLGWACAREAPSGRSSRLCFALLGRADDRRFRRSVCK